MCDGAHAGPCRYLTTQFFRRLNFSAGSSLVVSREPVSVEPRFAATAVPLGGLPGVFLLGNYFVGGSHDIGMRLTWHRHLLEQGEGEEFAAYSSFVQRNGGFLPRVSILSLHEPDLDYCASSLKSLGYPIINSDLGNCDRPECVAQEDPQRLERLQSVLHEINRRQDFSVHGT